MNEPLVERLRSHAYRTWYRHPTRNGRSQAEANLYAEAAERIEALEAALKPFALAWEEAMACSMPAAPLGAINNLCTYFVGAGYYQDASRALADKPEAER